MSTNVIYFYFTNGYKKEEIRMTTKLKRLFSNFQYISICPKLLL